MIHNNMSYFNHESSSKESLPLSIILLMPFLIGTVSVSTLPGFNYLVIGLGIICTVAFLMVSVRSGFFVPLELKLLMAFSVWGVFGLFVAWYPSLVFEKLGTLVQLLVMSIIISYYAQNTRCISWLFLAVFIGVLIISAGAVVTGEFARSEVEGEEARVVGFTMNANAFARAITFGIAILLFFFRQTRSKMVKLMVIGGILFSLRFVIASGSRQGFIGSAMLIFFWFLFTYGKELRARPGIAVMMLLGVAAIGVYMAYLMRDTVLMQRFLQLEESGVATSGSTGGSIGSRFVMLQEGLSLLLSNFVFGVGLNHFILHSVTEKYAHNNYIEVFATTGLPGGIFYYMIYVLIFYRLCKLRKYSLPPGPSNVVIIFKCMMLIQLAFDFFVVTYYSKMNWIFLAIIIGGLNYLQRDHEAVFSPDDENMALSQNSEIDNSHPERI